MRTVTLFGRAVIIAGLLAAAAPVFAQAWLPPKGEASVFFGYQFLYSREHLLEDGSRLAIRGQVRTSTLTADLGYAVSDRVSLRVGLPYVIGRYSGDRGHPTYIDDKSYHGNFQDFRFEARFNAVRAPLVVTPFAGVVWPSHDYEFFGHAAPGRRLREGLVGVNLARRLDPVLPNAYVHARYAHSFVQRVLGIHHDRSDVDLELGYFATPTLTLRTFGAWEFPHGGIQDPSQILAPPRGTGTPEIFIHHDQITAEGHFNLGFGTAYAATRNVDVFLSAIRTLSGKNAHAIDVAVLAGVAVSFSPAQMFRKHSALSPSHP